MATGYPVTVLGVGAVIAYCDPLATPDLVASGFPEGEKRWRKIRLILECTGG